MTRVSAVSRQQTSRPDRPTCSSTRGWSRRPESLKPPSLRKLPSRRFLLRGSRRGGNDCKPTSLRALSTSVSSSQRE
eukprot:scaffold17550_cov119-Isochrysis_galbana.AAC.1